MYTRRPIIINMKKIICHFLFVLLLTSCKTDKNLGSPPEVKTESFLTEDYEIIKPVKNSKAVLILFPAYGDDIESTKAEFNIMEDAKNKEIALIYMNYNDKLWLEDSDKKLLGKNLQDILIKYQLTDKDIFIGGHSAGGAISLLISNFLIEQKQFNIKPKGVFISDSPVDLLSMYRRCKEKIANNSQDAIAKECNAIVNYFNHKIGDPKNSIELYEKFSVYTLETNNTQNLNSLQLTNIRLYTEPAIEWWKEKFNVDYDETNAYQIKKLYEILSENDYKKVEFITTKDKGYRANGDRNPHSWSIIDKVDLLYWILKKN